MTAVLETAEAASDSGGSGPLIGHHAHPDDPSKRTALCGASILGISASGEYVVCPTCVALEARALQPMSIECKRSSKTGALGLRVVIVESGST